MVKLCVVDAVLASSAITSTVYDDLASLLALTVSFNFNEPLTISKEDSSLFSPRE